MQSAKRRRLGAFSYMQHRSKGWLKRGGVLDELRELAEQLAEDFDWDRSEAAEWVLGGAVPTIHRVRVSVDGVTDRIHFDVHAATAPADVGRVYRRLRNMVGRRSGRRTKRPEAVLVGFVEENGELTWRARLHAWNVAYPSWPYAAPSNMCRDYRRALRRGADS